MRRIRVATGPLIKLKNAIMRLRNVFNYREDRKKYPPKKAPCFAKPSATVPDLSMTIDELLVRYERGLPLPNMKTPIYEDENLPSTGRSVSHCDLIDIHYYKKNSIERLKILKENVDKINAKNAEEMKKRKINYEKYLEYLEKQSDEKGASGTNTP